MLTILAALILLARLYTYDEALDRDLGDYATVAHEMHMGKYLYTDLPDQKPPAIHLTYYLAEAIAGYGRDAIFLLTVTASLITLFAAYSACVALFGSRSAGLWAAAFWTIASGHVRLQGNQPNAEVFMNAFTMLGIACLARNWRLPAGHHWRNVVLAGLCFGWATLYKQVLVLTPALLGLAYLLAPPPGKPRLRALGEMLLVGGIIAGTWGLTIAWLAIHGQLQAFMDFVVTYNRSYAGNLNGNFWVSLQHLFPPWMKGTLPLAIAALGGIVLGIARRRWSPLLLLLALGLGTQIAVALPGRVFPHYYQLWFPFLILGSGFALAELEAAFPGGKASVPAGAAILVALLAIEIPNYCRPLEEWSKIKYGSEFLETNALARVLNTLLKPDETFFQMGDATELYPATGRRPPSCVLGVYGLYHGPLAERYRKVMLDDLASSKPDMLVVSRISAFMFRKDQRIIGFIDGNYSVYKAIMSRSNSPFMLMLRKGSNLEKRLAASPPLGSDGRKSDTTGKTGGLLR